MQSFYTGKKSDIVLIIVYAIHYIFNFLSWPQTKYSILAIALLTLIFIATAPINRALLALVCFSFVEGQGRVLWGYNPFFRIVFDMGSLLLTLRVFLKDRRIFNFEIIPPFISFLIILHIIWFFISIFNPAGAGPLYAFAAAKYYVLPLLFFAALSSTDELTSPTYLKKLSFVIVCLIIASCALSIYQLNAGEQSLYLISSNYSNLFAKYQGFTGYFFRPWATTHDAGAIAVFLNLSVGFILIYFLSQKNKFKSIIGLISITCLTWYTLFICQVRSASIKFTAILFLSLFFIMLINKIRIKTQAYIAITLALTLTATGLIYEKLNFDYEDAIPEHALKRYSNLFDENFNSRRATFDLFSTRLNEHVNWPLGHGPGMVTNFLPQIAERRKQMVWLNEDHLWSGDNFFLFSFLELGVGAIFYILIFFFMPIIVFARWTRLNHKTYRLQSNIVIIIIITHIITIIGNWGAVGLSFNPESFFFWLWTSIGLQCSKKEFHKSLKEEATGLPIQIEEHAL